MTIADDMRAASHGELARTKAQLKSANDEIEQLRGIVMKDQEALTAAESATLELRRELIDERYKAFQAEERSKDLARKLDTITARNDTWKRIALAYRCDRDEWARPTGLQNAIRVWSLQRRLDRRHEPEP